VDERGEVRVGRARLDQQGVQGPGSADGGLDVGAARRRDDVTSDGVADQRRQEQPERRRDGDSRG
jgi:hypothetical protein